MALTKIKVNNLDTSVTNMVQNMVTDNSVDSADVTLIVNSNIAAKSTSDLSEGTNLYFTNERVDDRVSALVVGGNNITATYNDTAGTLTIDGQPGYADSDVGSYLSTNGYATSSSIIGTITDNAPGTLDTLNELAAALGDDANFSTTVTNNIATKLPLAGGTMTGNIAHAGDFTIDAAGDIILDAGGAQIRFYDDGTDIGVISNESNNLIIKSQVSNADLLFKGNDGGSTVTALTLDMSEAGAATFNGNVFVPNKIEHVGDADTYLQFSGADDWRVVTGNVERFSANNSAVVVNEESADLDFRVESNSNTHMLFVDGGTNGVGINGTPFINFAASSYGHLVFGNAYATDGAGDIKNSGISWPSAANGNQVISSLINASQDGNYGAIMQFHTRNTGGGNLVERMRISQDELVINDASANLDFRVESNGNTHMLFVDAGLNRIGINESTPAASVDIRQSTNGNTDGLLVRPLNETQSMIYSFLGMRNTYFTHFISDSGNTGSNDHFKFFASTENAAGELLMLDGAGTTFNEGGADRDFRVESNSYDHALFVDAGADRLLIGKSSNVLGAAGHTFGLDGYLYHTRNGDIMWLNCLASSGTAITFMQNSVTKGSVTVNSTGTTYNTTSDRRLKDNIEPISDATDKLMDMKPVTHTWIDNPEAPQVHGFIAQEMQEVVPEAVSGDAESDEMMSMDYGRITPVIVAALQDALKEIKELKIRIDELENN